VQRDFSATGPDRLWVGDFTYLRSWEGASFFAGQMLDQHRRFLYQRGIRVLTTKASPGRGKGRVRERDPRQALDLLGGRPE
jgi:transposase InsO family protein